MSIEARRGGALLAVLWLAAALAAIAFSLANSVRGEAERTATASDGTRGYYLATGAIERAILYVQWGGAFRNPDGSPRYYESWMPALRFSFPTGEALVEIIPESSKLNINIASGEDLFRLLVALGAPPERAREIALAILDWRTPMAPGAASSFDAFYLSLTPSFRARHSSFEEIEEVLLVKGMTTELFHGAYERDSEGRLVARGALKNCISVFGATGRFDVNSAEPALLVALGINPDMVAALVQRRRAEPFRDLGQLASFAPGGAPGFQRLQIGGGSILTLRATGRVRLPDGKLSDLRRSVSAMVKFFPAGWNPSHQILRWNDSATVEVGTVQ